MGRATQQQEQEAFARLFPRAQVERRLRPHRPELGVVAARAWHRISLTGIIVGAAVLGEIMLLSAPPSILGFGWQLPLVASIALVGGLIGYAWSAHQVRPRAAEQPTTWERWASERGFRPVAQYQRRNHDGRGNFRRTVGSSQLHLQPSRSYTTLYQGRVRGDAHVIIGSAYVHGPWGSSTNRLLGHVAALVELPEQVPARYPASMLDRFLRGTRLRRSSRSTLALRELRLESSDLDAACDVRVAAGSEDLDWYELLDPEMVDGLVRDWPVSWQQHGTMLVVYSPAPIGRLDAAQLDAVCQAAAAITEHFREEAAAPHAAPDPHARSERRRHHRTRALLRRLTVTATILALLAAPIVVVVRLDAAKERAERERIDRRAEAFEREYAIRRDAELTSWAIERVATEVDTCLIDTTRANEPGTRCATLSADARARLVQHEPLDAELVDDVTITVDAADGATLTATSARGTTFTLRFQADALDEATRVCAPTGGIQCRTGSWGLDDG